MIDDLWRNFLRGEIVSLEKKLIQEALDNFFSFAIKNKLSDVDPNYNDAFKVAVSTTDLQRINAVWQQKFDFKFKSKHFSASLPSLDWEIKQVMGYEEYLSALEKGDAFVSSVDNYAKFFKAARELTGQIRNTEAHDKRQINDTSYALHVASTAMTIIERSPVPIRNQESLTIIKENLGELMKNIILKENPSITISEDPDDANDKEEIEALEKADAEAEDAMRQYFDTNFASVSESISQLNSVVKNFESDMFNEIQKAWEEYLERPRDKSTDEIIEAVTGAREKIEELIHKEQEQETSGLHSISREPLPKPALKEPLQKPALEDKPNQIMLTPQQAVNEMVDYQRKFKEKFKCANWQNLAQGPFRNEIITNEINSKEAFLNNPFVNDRYLDHKEEMDHQINSELGEEFFSILSRILFVN